MDPQVTALLSIAYMGPVQYFSKFTTFPKVLIEKYDHYRKQTYRNRCKIYGTNGTQTLTIPVQKGSTHKTLVKDVKIDYSENWQKLHWKSIESAYRSAAFYTYYHEAIFTFYQKKITFLIGFNQQLQEVMLDCLGIKTKVSYTDAYIKEWQDKGTDFRETIHPKKNILDPLFIPVEYFQVFSDKHGFQPNLSIIDLLFNMGPDAVMVLERCVIPAK